MTLHGKHVLISAGASGIGRAMASAFADAGAKVWVSDIDPEALAACPDDWKKTLLDVTDERAVARLYADLGAQFGTLDVLCANAGIAGPTATVEAIELADWQRCVAVNLEGAFLFAKHAIPMMKAARSGVILLTSSTGGIHGFPNRAPYASAKWALNGFMKTLAMELGPFGIRANSICPGGVVGPRMELVMQKEAQLKGTSRTGSMRVTRWERRCGPS